MSGQQTSYFQKMRSLQKGRGWGVFDVLLLSTKSMCVFYHQWCIDQRNLHEIQPHLSRQQQIQLFITNPSPTKHCAEACFSMFLLSLCFVQGPVVRPDERPERPRPAKRRPQTAPTLPGWLVCDLFWGWFTDYLLSLFQVGVFFQIGKPFVCC